MLKTQSLKAVVFLFAACAAGTACVPAQYQSIPVPANSGGKRQSAASDTGSENQAGQSRNSTNNGSTPSSPVASATPTVSPSAGTTFGPNVPEKDALKKCLNLWGTTPFKEVNANQVKVMDVSVGIGGGILGSTLPGIGSLFNIGNTKDFETTGDPRLVVIPMSVNVGGSTTFELMNPNGWYCLKAAVGAKSTISIRLHCSARIAQSDLGVSLNTSPSTASGTPPVSVSINDGKTPGSQLGIMVDSNVSLTRVNSNGGSCTP
ncbi:MAG: hypothetical protein RIR26_152 [Pseudomonadota bacterium]|jgi:hypothetical protein